ncbi:hypothetical protein PPTG_22016 [Phytophthora nicotianae INRA-310]|uniref:Uncharacterized protein n=1 Tax=Phytophthora nicotianae (strain INRA-310) TaxID=761204 RepID=W2QP10_PHYN3|nr:hypothetical protein PPTG_22016 [Phytophthora nicotianae INRA-310]ETN14833.1 hypothetical protein PPTG_22016 [Phytophthora nicotianae INRA-310]
MRDPSAVSHKKAQLRAGFKLMQVGTLYHHRFYMYRCTKIWSPK